MFVMHVFCADVENCRDRNTLIQISAALAFIRMFVRSPLHCLHRVQLYTLPTCQLGPYIYSGPLLIFQL